MQRSTKTLGLTVVIVGSAVALAAKEHALLVFSLLAVSTIAIVLIMRGGIYNVLAALLVAVGFFVPMDSLRAGAVGGLADALLLLALPLLFLERMTSRARWQMDHFLPVLLAAAILAFGGLLGTMWSDRVSESLINLARFSVGISCTLVAMAAVPRSRNDVRRFAWAFVFGATASAAYGFTNVNVYNGRSSGLAAHPNTMGMVSVFALTVLCGLMLTAPERWHRIVGVVCIPVLLGGVINSGSRAGVLAFAASVLVFLLLIRRAVLFRYGVPLLMLALLAIATGRYTLPPNSALVRLADPSLSAESDRARATLRSDALTRISEHGLTGSGFASATSAHSVPIQLVDSAGLIGAVAGPALVVMVLRPYLRRRSDPLIAAFLAMYASYLTASLFSNAIWDRWLWFPIACGLAAVAHSDRSRREPNPSASVPGTRNQMTPVAPR